MHKTIDSSRDKPTLDKKMRQGLIILLTYFTLTSIYGQAARDSTSKNRTKQWGQDSILVKTKRMPERCACYSFNNEKGLITSQEELDKNIRRNLASQAFHCDSYKLPKVNFKKKNLLWFNIVTSGNSSSVYTYLYKIPSQKKYFFLIKIIQLGNFSSACLENIRYEVDKLEKGYSFEYKIENINL